MTTLARRIRCTKATNTGTHQTRTEARRAQQRLGESEPPRNFIIKDNLERVVIWLRATRFPQFTNYVSQSHRVD